MRITFPWTVKSPARKCGNYNNRSLQETEKKAFEESQREKSKAPVHGDLQVIMGWFDSF